MMEFNMEVLYFTRSNHAVYTPWLWATVYCSLLTICIYSDIYMNDIK